MFNSFRELNFMEIVSGVGREYWESNDLTLELVTVCAMKKFRTIYNPSYEK